MTDTKIKHPDTCLVFLATEAKVGIVKWAERGYYQTTWPAGYTQQDIDQMNTRRGISKAESEAMISCSMNDSIDGNEEAWEKHYEMVLEMYHRKETNEKNNQ